MERTCLYTLDAATKKRKRWRDGVLVTKNDIVELFDTIGSSLGKTKVRFYRQALAKTDDRIFLIDRIIVQLEPEIEVAPPPPPPRRRGPKRFIAPPAIAIEIEIDRSPPRLEEEHCGFAQAQAPSPRQKKKKKKKAVPFVVPPIERSPPRRLEEEDDDEVLEEEKQAPLEKKKKKASFAAPPTAPALSYLAPVLPLPRLSVISTVRRTPEERTSKGYVNRWEAAVVARLVMRLSEVDVLVVAPSVAQRDLLTSMLSIGSTHPPPIDIVPSCFLEDDDDDFYDGMARRTPATDVLVYLTTRTKHADATHFDPEVLEAQNTVRYLIVTGTERLLTQDPKWAAALTAAGRHVADDIDDLLNDDDLSSLSL